MKRNKIVSRSGLLSLLITLLLCLVSVAAADVLDDFEDGDYTDNPSWDIVFYRPGMGLMSVVADPLDPGNLVLKGHGDETGHHVIGTDLETPVPWEGVRFSMDILASSGCKYHPAIFLRTDDPSYFVGVSLYYDWGAQDLPMLRVYEPGSEPRFPLPSSIEHPTEEWYRISGWIEAGTQTLYLDLRRAADCSLLYEVSYTLIQDLSTLPDIIDVWIGVEEYGWQYIDNVTMSAAATNVFVDIKPGSCPNPLNVKPYRAWESDADRDASGVALAKVRPNQSDRGAVLPVAILGTSELDVNDIDVTTVTLAGVSPLRFCIEDVATPVGPYAEECECSDEGPDGIADLTFKFSKYGIVLSLGDVYDGDIIPLTMSGYLIDGTPFEGTDCVLIINGAEPPSLASTFGLSNYPNPFNPTTSVRFSLPEAENVRLDVYNVMGQTVGALVNGYLPSGTHEVEWNASSLASGVYFYRLTAGSKTEVKRMLLLK
jgi:hypothetical protein